MSFYASIGALTLTSSFLAGFFSAALGFASSTYQGYSSLREGFFSSSLMSGLLTIGFVSIVLAG